MSEQKMNEHQIYPQPTAPVMENDEAVQTSNYEQIPQYEQPTMIDRSQQIYQPPPGQFQPHYQEGSEKEIEMRQDDESQGIDEPMRNRMRSLRRKHSCDCKSKYITSMNCYCNTCKQVVTTDVSQKLTKEGLITIIVLSLLGCCCCIWCMICCAPKEITHTCPHCKTVLSKTIKY